PAEVTPRMVMGPARTATRTRVRSSRYMIRSSRWCGAASGPNLANDAESGDVLDDRGAADVLDHPGSVDRGVQRFHNRDGGVAGAGDPHSRGSARQCLGLVL